MRKLANQSACNIGTYGFVLKKLTAAVISVRTYPGETELTLMPCFPLSLRFFVIQPRQDKPTYCDSSFAIAGHIDRTAPLVPQ